MMTKPLVSVKTVTYNHNRYIKKCLDGLLMQETDFPYEIIIGDDCSTDGTSKIVDEYAEKYPDIIRVIRPEENVGVRQNGINVRDACRGKYQASCEGDDYWTDPLKLQKQIDFLESNPDYAGCFTNFSVVNANSEIVKEEGFSLNKQRDLDLKSILKYQTPKTLTTVIRSSALPKTYPEEFYKVYNGDTFFFAMIAQKGPFKYLNINSGAYRVHEAGMWGDIESMEQRKKHLHTFKIMATYFTSKSEQEAIRERIANSYANLSNEYLERGNWLLFLKKSFLIFVYSRNVGIWFWGDKLKKLFSNFSER